MKVLITGACAVSARSVLRSLRMSDIFFNSEFIGWDMCNLLYEVYAHEFDRIYKVPPVSDPDYERVISDIIDKEKPDVAVIVPEVEVRYWTRKSFKVPCLLPPPKFSDIAISKESLFNLLEGSKLIPLSMNVAGSMLTEGNFDNPLGYPVWIRDGSAGTASAKGAFKAFSSEDLQAWALLNPDVSSFQISQFLPGRNLGCFCLFKKGNLIKMAQAERIDYIMGKVAISGITGNTSKGRLLNEVKIKNVAMKAIDFICKKTGEEMNGLVVVDMKEDEKGNPVITEINIRHVAFSSSFAMAGQNIAEAQVLLALNRDDEIPGTIQKDYPYDNLILRDVDGPPIYVPHPKILKIGEYI